MIKTVSDKPTAAPFMGLPTKGIPGDILKADFLDPLGMSVHALANAIHVPRTRINDIALGRPAVTAETAFWAGLQAQCDPEMARRGLDREFENIEPRAA